MPFFNLHYTYNPNHSRHVSIIIPFYNRIAMTVRSLKSIVVNSLTDKVGKLEIILVDDASEEHYDFSEFQSNRIEVRVLKNSANVGFARSCNRGAIQAMHAYLVFLNNDTMVQPGWLWQLLSCVDSDDTVGIAGNKLLYPDGSVQHAGVAFDEYQMPFHIYHRFPATFVGVNRLREFQAVTGACCMIKASCFDALNGFDESYQNGFEDIDLCLRAREKGWKVLYTPHSVVWHWEAKSRKRRDSSQNRNKNLYNRKWGHCQLNDYQSYFKSDLLDHQNLPPGLGKIRKAFGLPHGPCLGIWGAGNGGRHMMAMLKYIDVHADFLIDGDPKKTGKTVAGCRVYAPEHLYQLKAKGLVVWIVIASLWFEEIMQQLMEMGMAKNTENSDPLFQLVDESADRLSRNEQSKATSLFL